MDAHMQFDHPRFMRFVVIDINFLLSGRICCVARQLSTVRHVACACCGPPSPSPPTVCTHAGPVTV